MKKLFTTLAITLGLSLGAAALTPAAFASGTHLFPPSSSNG
jgi:hypothetical protein